MATVALRIVGTVLGGVFGPVGAAIGGAVGSLAGASIDNALINSTRTLEGARLSANRAMTADVGHAVPRAYGYSRVTGSVIWATSLLETSSTSRAGGKGGPKQTSYAYSCSFAVAICAGPVHLIKRIWADGKELDLRDISFRSYLGDESQRADPLIEAKQGADNTPAYRGIAYVVFDDFALERFGNRVPGFSFEIVKATGALEERVTAICLIPGSTEYGLSNQVVTQKTRSQGTVELNRHVLHGDTDYGASMDELQALCPNLKHVSVVVTWFGDDLRVEHCRIRPGVTQRDLPGVSEAWAVAGLARNSQDVHLCSTYNGRSNYGGTPTDASVKAVIQDLKQRGLSVTLNPFIMMDIEAGNGLADPWGGAEQAAHPWRGRITCWPAPGLPASPDNSALIASQCAIFTTGQAMGQNNPDNYRRFILHYAALAAEADGIDAFIIGSEMRGLTSLRDGQGFPFVKALMDLASDVRAVVGPQTKLTYGADWSEYFGLQARDGSGDIYYNLDPLWAHENIDAIGIDNYMPLADWRDSDGYSLHPNPDGALSAADKTAMAAMLRGGEGFDWFYASDADRQARVRTPITDGAYSKPWVYRYKDLQNWWSNRHYDRVNGVESNTASAWQPQSKQIWFTELGCPAIERGANQPNVFVDPKSSEDALPYFSNGSRDDAIQRAFLDVHLENAESNRTYNPMSDDNRHTMIDVERLYLWAWDARPYPAFPLVADVWADGDSWLRGHWLNGRLGAVPLAEWIAQTVAQYDLASSATVPVSAVLQGVAVASQVTGRAMVEPLMNAFGLTAQEDVAAAQPSIKLQRIDAIGRIPVQSSALVQKPDPGDRVQTIDQSTESPSRITFNYRDAMQSHLLNMAQSKRLSDGDDRVTSIDLPVAADDSLMRQAADQLLKRQWLARYKMTFALPASYRHIQPGDVIYFTDTPDERWLIDRVDSDMALDISATRIGVVSAAAQLPALPKPVGGAAAAGQFSGAPTAMLLDLPMWDGTEVRDQFRLAVDSVPVRPQSVFTSAQDSDYVLSSQHTGASIIATLRDTLRDDPSGRFCHGQAIVLESNRGEFASRNIAQVLAGNNVVAVLSDSGAWELIQFQNAVEIEPDVWRLTALLRGQAGTEDATRAGAAAGAPLVVMDRTITALDMPSDARGLDRHFRIGPQGKQFSDRYFTHLVAAGGERAIMPLSPVHLKVMGSRAQGLSFSWIRRGRIAADSWMGLEIPLGEASQSYQVSIADNAGAPLLHQTVEAPTLSVDDARAWPDEITISIAQRSDIAGLGLPLSRSVQLA